MDHSEVEQVLMDYGDLSRRSARRLLRLLAVIIKSGLVYDRTVQIDGLGSFGVKDVPESRIYPLGALRVIPAHGTPTFTPSRSLKAAVKDVRKSASG